MRGSPRDLGLSLVESLSALQDQSLVGRDRKRGGDDLRFTEPVRAEDDGARQPVDLQWLCGHVEDHHVALTAPECPYTFG